MEILSQYCSRLFQDLVTCVTDHSQNVLGLACLSSHIQRSVHIPMAGKNFGFIEARKWLLQRFTNVSTSSCVFSTSTTSCEYDSNRISNDLYRIPNVIISSGLAGTMATMSFSFKPLASPTRQSNFQKDCLLDINSSLVTPGVT